MGATTIWERWNSVLPDGRISSTGMNSLNHYAYGSILEWMYRDLLGLSPIAAAPGFARARIEPRPDYRFSWLKGRLKSPYGEYILAWRLVAGRFALDVTVPPGCRADLVLPDADATTVDATGSRPFRLSQNGDQACTELLPGQYQVAYQLTRACRQVYSVQSGLDELKANPAAWAQVRHFFPEIESNIPFVEESSRLVEILLAPFVRMPREQVGALDAALRAIES